MQQRRLLREGVDPLDHRQGQEEAAQQAVDARRTFQDCAIAFLAEKAPEWRNAKHRAQWNATLTTYAMPELGDMPVATIDQEAVKRVLSPIWSTKPETAARLRGRIEAVLDHAGVHGWREGANPARWKGNLSLSGLPSRAKVAPVQHHPALPWREMAGFMSELQASASTSARALVFLILTAARTGEVLGARWVEIDLATGMWTVPRDRMKAGREHRVPCRRRRSRCLSTCSRCGRRVGRAMCSPARGKGIRCRTWRCSSCWAGWGGARSPRTASAAPSAIGPVRPPRILAMWWRWPWPTRWRTRWRRHTGAGICCGSVER